MENDLYGCPTCRNEDNIDYWNAHGRENVNDFKPITYKQNNDPEDVFYCDECDHYFEYRRFRIIYLIHEIDPELKKLILSGGSEH